jgi:uncharacterized protein YjdB
MKKNLIIAFLSIIAMGCSKESEPSELEVNQTMTLSATYTPSDATYKQLKFESSDTTVALVKDSIVTAKVAGILNH